MKSLKNRLEKLVCDRHKHPLTQFNIFQGNGNQNRVFCKKCECPQNSINVVELFDAYQQLLLNDSRFNELQEEFNSQLNILQYMIKQLSENFYLLIRSKSKTILLKEFDELINDPQINKYSLNKILQNISQYTVGKVEQKYIYIEEEVTDQKFAIIQELISKLNSINKFSQQNLLINDQNYINQPNNNDYTITNPYYLQKQIQTDFKSIKNMYFNYDSTKLLIRGDDNQTDLQVWKKQGNSFVQSTSLNCHKIGILHLCVSRQSDLYFTAGIDDKSNDYLKPCTNSIKIWNPEVELITRNHCIIYETHSHIGCMVLSNQEQYLAIGDGHSIKIFSKNNLNQYIAIQTPNQQKEFVKCLVFDELDQRICCGTENSDILVYKLEDQKLSLNQKIQAGYIPKQLRFANGGFFFSLNRDGVVQVFKSDAKQLDFQCVQTISKNNVKIRSIAINTISSEIVLGLENNQIEFMELRQGKWESKSKYKQESYVEFLCFSPVQCMLGVTNESKIMIYQQSQ